MSINSNAHFHTDDSFYEIQVHRNLNKCIQWQNFQYPFNLYKSFSTSGLNLDMHAVRLYLFM